RGEHRRLGGSVPRPARGGAPPVDPDPRSTRSLHGTTSRGVTMRSRSVTTMPIRSGAFPCRRDTAGTGHSHNASTSICASLFRITMALAAILSIALPGSAIAQDVVLTGRGEASIDRRLELLLASGDYVLVANDTLITDSVPTTLLILDATVTLEGAVAGDLIAVDANVFVRPRASVHGDVVNIAGGIYPSALATVGGTIVDRPLATYTVR